MGFRDVHHEEINLALVLIVKLIEGGNLPPEGRSGIAAEHKHDRLRLIQLGKMNGAGLINFG